MDDNDNMLGFTLTWEKQINKNLTESCEKDFRDGNGIWIFKKQILKSFCIVLLYT